MNKLDIVGISEVSEMLGVSKFTVSSWNRRSQLPVPDAQLAAGPVWRRSTIEKWKKGRGRERIAKVA